jgi:CheY-like chemotaxis protein
MARSTEEALNHLARERPNVIVADYAIPGTTGVAFLQQARTHLSGVDGQIRAILFSALSGLDEVARDAGFDRYLIKPLDPEVLVTEIVRLVTK